MKYSSLVAQGDVYFHFIYCAVLCGYPPKEISSYDGRASLKDVAINSGDTVTVVALSEPRVPAVKNEQARERVGPDLVIVDDESSTHVKHKREGKLTRKFVLLYSVNISADLCWPQGRSS